VDRFAEGRSDELARYKDGYDYKTGKVYILAVIRAIEDIRRYRNSDNFSFPSLSQQEETTLRSQLISLEGDLSDQLENQGIEKFDPQLGPIDPAQAHWMETSIPELTWDASLVNNIAAVEQSGWLYYLTDTDDPKIVKPAVVRVYVLHEGGQTND
jgi:molecular chaperone GrpE (heat shock protein)